jgi:serine protease AprX
MTAFASARADLVLGRAQWVFRLLLASTLLALAPAAFGQAVVGPSLDAAIAGAPRARLHEVIVTFDGAGPLSLGQLGVLQAHGLRGVYFQNLPIAGVLATRPQVRALQRTPGVRSLWLNEPLQYENEVPTALTGVDRLRADARLRTAAGLPYSGAGVGVLVNDSGIDGTHPDLQFGSHVVQNVLAQTNLHAQEALLPITYVENVPNTDIGAGHGTHVAGIVGGTGQQSAGRYEGVAPGAGLIGYGSGAALFILDTIGGFDYALTHHTQYNIRVVSNSFGNTGDVGTPFNPDDPTNVATKALADRGIVVVFSAGNAGSGQGTITGNFKKAPWVVLVAAGDDLGLLADFSSRGVRGGGGTVTVDGQTFAWVDRPTVAAPGVDVLSARASLGDSPPDPNLPPSEAPWYVPLSGTSMACPHISGVVALMLQANPTLDVYDVKALLEATATNMPGMEAWEAGAGYVNAYAAVQAALGRSTRPFGETVNATRAFNASAIVTLGGTQDFAIDFVPVGATEEVTFEVAADISRVTAQAQVSDNAVALVLLDPAGNRYGSAISLPVLGENIAVSAPGMAGTWTLTVRGVGSVSGTSTDPLGLTNGTSAPGTVSGTLYFQRTGGYTGLSDVAGHPAAADIQYAVSYRLMDGLADGTFRPSRALKRLELAEYLAMGAGVRQALPLAGRPFSDVNNVRLPFVAAVTTAGAPLRDVGQTQAGLIRTTGSTFDPGRTVTRADLAYALVQALGLQPQVAGYAGPVTVVHEGEVITLADDAQVPAALRGYVQAALFLGLLTPRIVTQDGATTAYFDPSAAVTRAAYAVHAGRFFDSYFNGFTLAMPAGASLAATPAAPGASVAASGFALEQNAPNPVAGPTAIHFSLPSTTAARLAVYDAMGREVAVLAEGTLEAGAHAATWDASGLAAGVYVYRLTAGDRTAVRRMVVVR